MLSLNRHARPAVVSVLVVAPGLSGVRNEAATVSRDGRGFLFATSGRLSGPHPSEALSRNASQFPGRKLHGAVKPVLARSLPSLPAPSGRGDPAVYLAPLFVAASAPLPSTDRVRP